LSYSIISTQRFIKELKQLVKKFPLLKSEFARFVANIIENPETGAFIGNSCYKARLAIASKG
jgi:mRNA-degrading endonuclease RelE of RelBE toxin-antitoxin system